MEKKELEKTILNYMKSHHTISLATEKNGVPHAATVFFVNIGFELYFFSSSGSRHGENFLQNPKVSGTINEDYFDWKSIKGIQIEGLIEKVGSVLKNTYISMVYVNKFPGVADFIFSPQKLGETIAEKIAGVDFFRLKPSTIYFLDNAQGFGHRDKLVLSNQTSP